MQCPVLILVLAIILMGATGMGMVNGLQASNTTKGNFICFSLHSRKGDLSVPLKTLKDPGKLQNSPGDFMILAYFSMMMVRFMLRTDMVKYRLQSWIKILPQ